MWLKRACSSPDVQCQCLKPPGPCSRWWEGEEISTEQQLPGIAFTYVHAWRQWENQTDKILEVELGG